MKLHQLRYLAAVVDNNLNITAAAEKLYTSQPGISKQLRMLEDELGVELFQRSGKSLVDVTPAGTRVVARAKKVLQEVENIRGVADEFKDEQTGTLSIATTNTQARYVLPPVIQQFRKSYPNVQIHLHQGSNEQIAEQLSTGEADVVIASGAGREFSDVIQLPCYSWERVMLVPDSHELNDNEPLTLAELASQPLITYSFSLGEDSSLVRAFHAQDLTPNIALSARDADVIKTYVRLGLGVGVIAEMAFDELQDEGLRLLRIGHLLPATTTWLGFREGVFLRSYAVAFMRAFAPHLSQDQIEWARDNPQETSEGPTPDLATWASSVTPGE